MTDATSNVTDDDQKEAEAFFGAETSERYFFPMKGLKGVGSFGFGEFVRVERRAKSNGKTGENTCVIVRFLDNGNEGTMVILNDKLAAKCESERAKIGPHIEGTEPMGVWVKINTVIPQNGRATFIGQSYGAVAATATVAVNVFRKWLSSYVDTLDKAKVFLPSEAHIIAEDFADGLTWMRCPKEDNTSTEDKAWGT